MHGKAAARAKEELEGDTRFEVRWQEHWPPAASAEHKLAAVVPYRNRNENRTLFAAWLGLMLRLDGIELGCDAHIYFVNQGGDDPAQPFNQGMLCNVGFRLTQAPR
jgi:N-terminal region of glycosyl transferase group 7